MITLDLNKSNGLLDLTKEAPNFNVIRGSLNWDMHPVKGNSLTEGFDLDIFVFALNSAEKITSLDDVAFFNKKSILGGAITVPVDNRTGEGDNDEYTDIKLNLLSADKEFVDVYVIIHDAERRGQNFGMIANSSFVLTDADKKVDIAKYKLTEYTNETAIHIGRFKKVGSNWNFESQGVGGIADPNQIVGAYM